MKERTVNSGAKNSQSSAAKIVVKKDQIKFAPAYNSENQKKE